MNHRQPKIKPQPEQKVETRPPAPEFPPSNMELVTHGWLNGYDRQPVED